MFSMLVFFPTFFVFGKAKSVEVQLDFNTVNTAHSFFSLKNRKHLHDLIVTLTQQLQQGPCVFYFDSLVFHCVLCNLLPVLVPPPLFFPQDFYLCLLSESWP